MSYKANSCAGAMEKWQGGKHAPYTVVCETGKKRGRIARVPRFWLDTVTLYRVLKEKSYSLVFLGYECICVDW